MRGQWRQDALEVDAVGMQGEIGDGQEDINKRNEELNQKGLEGEVKDQYIDYKEEALRSFVDIIEKDKTSKAKSEE